MSERKNVRKALTKTEIEKILPEDSPIRIQNSWKPFISAVEGALKAHDLRTSTIRSIIHQIDPHFRTSPSSYIHRVLGWLIGPGFFMGRRYLYREVFERFSKKYSAIFIDAPEQAISAYNRLIGTLFMDATSSSKERKSMPSLAIDISSARRKKSRLEEELDRGREALASIEAWISSPEEFFSSSDLEISSNTEEERSSGAPSEDVLGMEEKKDEIEDSLSSLPLHKDARKKLLNILVGEESGLTSSISELLAHIHAMFSPYREKLKELYSVIQDDLLLQFTDIADAVSYYTALPLPEAVCATLIQGEFSELSSYLDAKSQEVHMKVREFQERKKSLQRIEAGRAALIDSLEPLLNKKDVRPKVQEYLYKLRALSFPQKELLNPDSAAIRQKIKALGEGVAVISKDISDQLGHIIGEIIDIDESVEKERLLFWGKLWDICTSHALYPDLLPVINSSKISLTDQVEALCANTLSGEISYADFSQSMRSLIYSHDVALIRSELFVRSRRIKDLRTAFRRELNEVDQWLLFIEIIAPSLYTSSDAVREAITARDELLSRYLEWLNPKEKFSSTQDPESINSVFRDGWISVEEWQRGKKHRVDALCGALEGVLKKGALMPLVHACDRIQSLLRYEDCTLNGEAYEYFVALNSRSIATAKDMKTFVLNGLVDGEKKHPIYGYLLVIAQFDRGDERDEILRRILRLIQNKNLLIQCLKDFQALKTYDVEYEGALLEFFDEMPGPLLLSFPFSSKPMLEGIKDALDIIERAIGNIGCYFLLDAGVSDPLAQIERLDMQERFQKSAMPVIDLVLTFLRGEVASLQGNEKEENAAIALFSYMLSHIDTVLQRDVREKVQASKRLYDVLSDIGMLVIAVRLWKISEEEVVQWSVSDCYWILSWMVSIVLLALHESRINERDHKRLVEMMISGKNGILKSFSSLNSEEEMMQALDEVKHQIQIRSEPILTESLQAVEVIQEFLLVIEACQKRLRTRGDSRDVSSKHVKEERSSAFSPFLYGDIQALLK